MKTAFSTVFRILKQVFWRLIYWHTRCKYACRKCCYHRSGYECSRKEFIPKDGHTSGRCDHFVHK